MISPLADRWHVTFLVVVASSCGALWSAKCQASEAPDDGKQERNGTMELIDALVNANSAPKLIKSFGTSRPLFSREYNWAEQSRARKVFVSLTEVHSAEAWDEMLKHADDSRYCLTMCRNGETDHTENHSVGSLCELIAYHQLVDVARVRLRSLRAGFLGNIDLDGMTF